MGMIDSDSNIHENGEPIDDAAYEAELAVQQTSYRASKPEMHLTCRGECIKSNWYEWSCERDGVLGYVQADFTGELIAHDTFEAAE